MGKDKTICHLKTKHPHQATTITMLEEQIHRLQGQLLKKTDQQTKTDLPVGYLERNCDKATEKEKFEQQLSSIQTLYQLTIHEKNGFVKEKEDLLKEYRELQQLIKRPLVNTTGQTTSYETKNKKPEEWEKALQQ